MSKQEKKSICSGCCTCRYCGTEYDGHAIFPKEPERYVVQDLNCRTRIWAVDADSHGAAAIAACQKWDQQDGSVDVSHEVEVTGPGGTVWRFDVIATWPVVYKATLQEG
jgi:hypothetical protein